MSPEDIETAIRNLQFDTLNSKYDIVTFNGKAKFFMDIPEEFQMAYHNYLEKQQLNQDETTNPRLFVIGEVHDDISPKKFLIENMEKFATNGYKILYLEHLLYDKHFNPASRNLLENAEEWLKDVSNGHYGPFEEDPDILSLQNQYNYLTLVETAKKHDLQVIPIDSSYSYASQEHALNEEETSPIRCLAFTTQASAIIKKTQGEDKAIALIGNVHLLKYKNIPGISCIFKTNNLYITDIEDPEQHPYTLDTQSSPHDSLENTNHLQINREADVSVYHTAFIEAHKQCTLTQDASDKTSHKI